MGASLRGEAVVEVPAVALLRQADDAVLDVLQRDGGGGLAQLPLAVLVEALELLDGDGVEAGLRVLHLLVELAAVDALDAVIDEARVGQLRDEVFELLGLDRLEDR